MYSFCVHECVVTYFYLIIVIGPVVDCGEGPVGPRYLTTTNAVSSIFYIAIPRKPKLTEYAEEKKTEEYRRIPLLSTPLHVTALVNVIGCSGYIYTLVYLTSFSPSKTV